MNANYPVPDIYKNGLDPLRKLKRSDMYTSGTPTQVTSWYDSETRLKRHTAAIPDRIFTAEVLPHKMTTIYLNILTLDSEYYPVRDPVSGETDSMPKARRIRLI